MEQWPEVLCGYSFCMRVDAMDTKRDHVTNEAVNSHDNHGAHGIQHTLQEDLELERQLQLINKSPVKSVHTKFGYIVDCIDIYKQPALDHPLLKNHKLQRKPSFQNSFEKTSVMNFSTKSIFELEKDECPRGTVPIRRTTKDNLIQSKLLSNNHILVQDLPGVHLAEVYLIGDGPYYKVSGTNSIYNPGVSRNDQMSMSHMWVQNGLEDATNKISIGWHVAPQFHGDTGTYIYSSWTDITGDWWITYMGENIGYFPSKLFSNMTSANQVGWGGRTSTPPGTPSPQMGSGYFPDENFSHACYFRCVSFQNDSRTDYGPPLYDTDTLKDNPKCFGVDYYDDLGGEVGYSLQFGGPGVNSHDNHGVRGIQHTLQEDLELERQLQLINKTPVKSVHTKFGYIVDCIDIYKQPAFDHPLLKNHKLQRKPIFQNSFEKIRVVNSSTKSIFGLEKDECPRGTVPIRRTTKDNLIQSKLLSNNHILVQDLPGVHLAEVYLIGDGPYYKVNGSTSIYNPEVSRNDQMSMSHIWVQNGLKDVTNKISIGWHVAPQFHGDTGTYIYSSWTATTGDWWINCLGENIGYFPSKLFSNMTSADQVGWGGRTSTPPGTPSPQMGSGYFPDKNFVHACYFREISFQNESRIDYGPPLYDTDTFKDSPSCFGVDYYEDQGEDVGYSLQFGGPGGQCGD
ncbi:hypothetical protein VNO80_05664 [Phaseolus coccineus]|uniref:Neprosin PEP catalytic domain-containing protein n=1 Tax=Phaseolus coccineus TaxID=3886 RepID=A0AAN9RI27_PHACN